MEFNLLFAGRVIKLSVSKTSAAIESSFEVMIKNTSM